MKGLIGIAGAARSGKDTVASFLIEAMDRKNICGMRYSFADPLKRAASEMFGVDLDIFYSDDKEMIDSFWGISYREMLQKMGTQGGRELFFNDIWIRRAQLTLNKMPDDIALVIPDIRFDNEAEWIRSNGGSIIHVEREKKSSLTETATSHLSEMGIQKNVGDYTIHNNGSLEDLKNKTINLTLLR